jgi:hypothetical protein
MTSVARPAFFSWRRKRTPTVDAPAGTSRSDSTTWWVPNSL